jgi:hypothetical protein
MFKIIASSRYGREIVDEAETEREAERLAAEYRMAFGPGFSISVRKPFGV